MTHNWLLCAGSLRGSKRQRAERLLNERDSQRLSERAAANKTESCWRTCESVPFVNRRFESEIRGTLNSTTFCCALLVTWCHRVRFSCYLRPK